MASWVARLMAIYSASVLDSEMVDWCLETHEIGPLVRQKTYPDIEWESIA